MDIYERKKNKKKKLFTENYIQNIDASIQYKIHTMNVRESHKVMQGECSLTLCIT